MSDKPNPSDETPLQRRERHSREAVEAVADHAAKARAVDDKTARLSVREAVYRAIDVKAIVDKIMRGHATPTGQLHAPSLRGFVPELNDRIPYDPARAKELLSEAGYPQGFSVGMNCPNNRYINDEAVCQAITAMLAQVGIKVALNAEPRARFFERVQKRDASFFLMGWGAATTRDAHNVLSDVLHSPDGKQGSWNAGGFSNKRVDELTDLIGSENDEDARQKMIAESFKIVRDEFGYIPLYQQNVIWGVRDRVNLIQSPDDILRLNFVRIE